MANTGNSISPSVSDKWYFTKEELENTPSRKCGYDSYKELSYRQQAANFIQNMGQRLKVSQLCINTAIVYMHRFYIFHSFTHFPWHQMAAAALFLAAKVEEQPRKLEYVIRAANICRNPRDTSFDINSERYQAQSQDLVFNENVLLQTLGFDVAIDHPHTHVVRCCHLVRASKDLAQTSYFMASNSLHLTTMCIQYKPTVVACFCILVACKWSNWKIPLSNEKKEWYSYVDPTVTAELLQQLTEEFLVIFESCPSRLKDLMAVADVPIHNPNPLMNSPFDTDPKKVVREDGKDPHLTNRAQEAKAAEEAAHKHRSSRPHEAGSSSQQQREREYREKKERERLAQQHGQKPMSSSNKPISHGHHRPPLDQKMKPHSRPPSSVSSGAYPSTRAEPRDILREASRDSPFGLANKDYRESSREHSSAVRSDKEVQKREYLPKPNVIDGTNSLNNYSADSRLNYSNSADKQRLDPTSRSRVDKVPPNKHESARNRHEDSTTNKAYFKESDNMKKHLSSSGHDKNSSSAYLNKSSNATSQKTKSPQPDTSKSVPKPNANQMPKPHHHNNGSSSNGSYNFPMSLPIKDEVITPAVIKRPSLFSPEKTPPQQNWSNDNFAKTSLETPPSMEESPVGRRNRNYSSGSEPELRPVIKKIDQVEGFENLMRDSTIGMNKFHQIPDIITPIAEKKVKDGPQYSKEMKPPDIIPPLGYDNNGHSGHLVNGIETNPTLISNLLKETPSVSHLSAVVGSGNNAVVAAVVDQAEAQLPLENKEKDHHHHKSKKKNKEKHKHKDKNREEKEKKKKHKDKDREKHKHRDKQAMPTVEPLVTEPIKIKIHKDKIQPLTQHPTQSIALKIKIPKDKIKTENIGEPSSTAPSSTPLIGGLKIKIPKDVINNCNNSEGSKKRERDRSSSGDSSAPPSKVSKSSYNKDSSSKQNGRHPYKVAKMGDGGTSLHRLAESKYVTKGSSS